MYSACPNPLGEPILKCVSAMVVPLLAGAAPAPWRNSHAGRWHAPHSVIWRLLLLFSVVVCGGVGVPI